MADAIELRRRREARLNARWLDAHGLGPPVARAVQERPRSGYLADIEREKLGTFDPWVCNPRKASIIAQRRSVDADASYLHVKDLLRKGKGGQFAVEQESEEDKRE